MILYVSVCRFVKTGRMKSFDSIELAVFSGRLKAICEEMGYTLQRSALSPNIKDRLDFSCAIFDAKGEICSQAAHIPVHLGSMAFAMEQIVQRFVWHDGDVVVFNDPFLGGTHLPDVTLVSPLVINQNLLGFVACRAHHANIGASSAGSMPLSDDASDEGVMIAPQKLYERGRANQVLVEILAQIEHEGSTDLKEGVKEGLPGDFLAQLSANAIGVSRLRGWINERGSDYFLEGICSVNDYGRELAQAVLSSLPHGHATFEDVMDDDGFGTTNVGIKLALSVRPDRIVFDFEGTAKQVRGNINCPLSVTAASVYYTLMCLLPDYAPCCQGVFECVDIRAPEGCFIHAQRGAPVAAGNVETSMRIVDVALGALNVLGVDVPAASQGTMNNIAFGANAGPKRWDYYETLGGGGGASASGAGLSASQQHMTNSLNTPIESLESHYPIRIERYQMRRDSGGEGQHQGGRGLVRSYRFLEPASVTLLTERRDNAPWGLSGGGSGSSGANFLNEQSLPAKVSLNVEIGDLLEIHTPGGGGFGTPDSAASNST